MIPQGLQNRNRPHRFYGFHEKRENQCIYHSKFKEQIQTESINQK
jgi:Ni,Fe-hydrogenase I small subunit